MKNNITLSIPLLISKRYHKTPLYSFFLFPVLRQSGNQNYDLFRSLRDSKNLLGEKCVNYYQITEARS